MNDTPIRISQLELPNRAGLDSVRKADLDLLKRAPQEYLDTTHFDTVRFPPPSWALRVFSEAANNGKKAYSPYRGNLEVLETLNSSLSKLIQIRCSN